MPSEEDGGGRWLGVGVALGEDDFLLDVHRVLDSS